MENPINITLLNDFIFCPLSIYYHNLYGEIETKLYQNHFQINGSYAHKTVDTNKYSTSAHILQGTSVYSKKYNLIGKIDVFDIKKKLLTERKNKITDVFDGYIFQLYAQYFALVEMGYEVEHLQLYSMIDNKKYKINLPTEDALMLEKFEITLNKLNNFKFNSFTQQNALKCRNCIYEPYCDRGV